MMPVSREEGLPAGLFANDPLLQAQGFPGKVK